MKQIHVWLVGLLFISIITVFIVSHTASNVQAPNNAVPVLNSINRIAAATSTIGTTTSTWLTYEDPIFHFEFLHPASWTSQEYQRVSSTYVDVSPVDIDQVLASPGNVARSYVDVEPLTCVEASSAYTLATQSSTVTINGISMEQVQDFSPQTSTLALNPYYMLYTFVGNQQADMPGQCYLIILYVPSPANQYATVSGTTWVDTTPPTEDDVRLYNDDIITENEILASFRFD